MLTGNRGRFGRPGFARRIAALAALGFSLWQAATLPAQAQCTAPGAGAPGTLTPGTTVTCNSPPNQTTGVGQGPGADNITLNANNGANILVTNQNAISLGNNVTVTLGTGSGAPVVVQTTTNSGSTGGNYGDGDNTVDVGSNSTITINSNASVIATGTQQQSEAINPNGPGNHIINYGLIQGGPSSAIFFQNVNTNASSPRNVVDNFGTIQLIPLGQVNPVTGGQAVGSNGSVGIDFINETGAKVIGNLDLQGGNDRVTLNPGSSITGDFDGGGGVNTLTLNASGTSADTFTGIVKNFQELDKMGAGTWTLTGSVGQVTQGSPLTVQVFDGTLVLTGNNANFNGTITVNPGSSIAVPGPTPSATLEARAQSLPPLITDHGIVLINQVSPDGIQPADGSYAGVIQGTGIVVKAGTGTLTMTGANTYTGGTYINVGTLAIPADSALGAPTAPVTFNGGTLQFLNSFNLAPTRDITLNAASPGLAGGGTFDTNGNTSTITQGIAGAGGLTKAGAGTLTLAGADTYSGGTTISGGTLQLGGGGTTGSIIGDVTDNGTLEFNRSDVVLFPGLISGAGGIVQAGTGTTILTQNQTFTGGTVISQGTLQLGNGGGTAGRVIGPILDNGALVVNRADVLSIPGQVSGTGSLSQIGTGTTILSAANTYTGGTTITQGTLQVGDGTTNGSIVGNVLDNATLSFNRADTVTFPGVVTGTGLVANYGSGTTILTGASSYTGGTRVAAGAIQLGNGGTSGSITGDVSLTGGTLIFDRADVVTFPGTISGAGGSVVQAGTGTTILTANNTYTQGTTISAGTLQLGNGGTSGSISSDAVADSGTLAFNRSDTVTVPYLISGTGSVAQIGTGTTILTANNIYTGTTTISAGTLQLGNGGSSGRVAGDVLDNAALVFDRSDVDPFGGQISGTGTVTQAGSGTTILTANNTYIGGTTISAGTLQLGIGGTSGSIVGDVADSGTLAFDRSDTVTFPGIISGSGAVVQAGTGATILTAVSSFTGGTTVSAGTLAAGDSGHPGAALSGGGPVAVAPGATLGGYGSVSGTLVNNGVVAAGNALPLFSGGPTGTFTVNGGVQNAGLLNAASPGAPGNTLLVIGNYAATSPASALAVSTLLNGGGALSNQFTDRLLIRGSDPGTTTVRVNATGEGGFTSVNVPTSFDGISLVQVGGSSSPGAFALAGGYVTGGTPYQYVLNAYGPGSPNGPAFAGQSLVGNAGNNWDYRLQNVFLEPGGPVPPEPPPPEPPPGPGQPEPQPPDPTPPPGSRPEVAPQVPAYISAPQALFQAGYQDLDSLHRRLGEIRDDQTLGRTQDYEVFLRSYGSTMNYSSTRSFSQFGYNFGEDYGAVQFGATKILVNDQDGTLRLGGAVTIGQLWYQPSALDGSSKGNFEQQRFAAIGTWQARAGWYVDAIVMGGAFDGHISTTTRGQTVGINGTSVAASIEAGYPIPLGWQALSIEPQAQIVWQNLNAGSRTDVDGIGVKLGNQNQGIFRAGARLTRPFAAGDGTLVTPYLKANLLQGIGGGGITVGGVGFGIGSPGTVLQAGGGVTGTLTKNLSVYGDVAWQSNVGGAGGARGWAFNGGLRLAF